MSPSQYGGFWRCLAFFVTEATLRTSKASTLGHTRCSCKALEAIVCGKGHRNRTRRVWSMTLQAGTPASTTQVVLASFWRSPAPTSPRPGSLIRSKSTRSMELRKRTAIRVYLSCLGVTSALSWHISPDLGLSSWSASRAVVRGRRCYSGITTTPHSWLSPRGGSGRGGHRRSVRVILSSPSSLEILFRLAPNSRQY